MKDTTVTDYLLVFFISIAMLACLLSINIKSDKINKQLETIIKLEEKQTAKETPKETTTPELIIEENTLGR